MSKTIGVRARLIALAATTLLALASQRPLGAQECTCAAPPLPVRRSVFVSTGGALLRVSSINQHLATANYVAVSNDAIGFGIGGFGSFGPLRLGVEHVRLDAGEESSPGGLTSRLEASYTTLTLGWDFRPRGRLSVAPTLGVGRGSYVVTVGDQLGGATPPASPPPSFDEILASPGRSSRIAGGHWIYEPMLAADLLVLRRASARRGITLGMRAGYRIAPNRPEWSYRGERAAGGPVDQAAGPIIRLTVGVGAR